MQCRYLSGRSNSGLHMAHGVRDLDAMTARPPLPPRALPDDIRIKLKLASRPADNVCPFPLLFAFSFSLLLKFPAVRAGSHDASRAWRRRCACSSALDSSRKIRFCCIWGICKLPALHIIGHACLLYFSQCFILPGLLFWLRSCRHSCPSS